MMQPGLFDWQTRFEQLDNGGDLQRMRDKDRKSNAGRKPFDVVLMFKVMVLQSLYNLSDDAAEFQMRDRLSFMRFLGLGLGDTVPDAKTIWLFRELLTEAGLVKPLFNRFDAFLRENGFSARKGQIVDASIVPAPRQRNSRDDNRQIKDGRIPEDWSENKRRQKDTDARWIQKNGKACFGYKNHIQVDVGNKLIRDYAVTAASVHDSQVFEELLDEDNSRRDVWADSAYRSKDALNMLARGGFREHLQRKGCRHKKLSEREKRGNHTRSKIRSRVEHIFGVQAQRAGVLLLRAIGLTRAKARIGLRNLAYNIDRFCLLATA